VIIPQGRRWERMLLRMAQHCSGLLTSAASEFGKREELQAVMSVLHSWNSRVVGSSDRLKELLQSRADWAAIKICPLDAMKVSSGYHRECVDSAVAVREPAAHYADYALRIDEEVALVGRHTIACSGRASWH
jgi:hypothetical protein